MQQYNQGKGWAHRSNLTRPRQKLMTHMKHTSLFHTSTQDTHLTSLVLQYSEFSHAVMIAINPSRPSQPLKSLGGCDVYPSTRRGHACPPRTSTTALLITTHSSSSNSVHRDWAACLHTQPTTIFINICLVRCCLMRASPFSI